MLQRGSLSGACHRICANASLSGHCKIIRGGFETLIFLDSAPNSQIGAALADKRTLLLQKGQGPAPLALLRILPERAALLAPARVERAPRALMADALRR
eukprot:4589458-Pyramimonas_sp.AAC.1